MKKRRLYRQDKVSSALVITLLGVVLLTIIVLAFMQTMSLSLATSKSYVDIRRATFAAQAGLDTAVAQLSLATGTNLAFVTGLTNFTTLTGSTNFPVTVIAEDNLTNLDRVMPLVSGNLANLTNFGVAGFGTNGFVPYIAPLLTNSPANVVDVNTPYQFIDASTSPTVTTAYLGSWVTMTNVVGSQLSYTRYAYVVLDDAARVNPTLMTGSGTGFINPTNWYSGPQDINVTTVTNSSGSQLLTSSQLTQITNSTTPAAFGDSDATLGNIYTSRTAYEANKVYLTSRTNASFDVIPAWLADGGKPKYNINDLATNPAYGSTPLARSLYMASIITNNLPNFYMRDAALSTVGTNYSYKVVGTTVVPTGSMVPDNTLYAQRLTANIVDYISPDGTFGNSDYSTNMTGITPTGHGVYPVLIYEADWVVSGAGTSTTKSTSSTYASQFWLSVWNPYTTPVTISSASLHISDRPSYWLGTTNTVNPTPDYNSPVSVISGANGSSGPPYVVQPNEFVVMGFVPQTNTVVGTSTANGPSSFNADGPYADTDNGPLEQYSLTINGQTTGQSGANNTSHTPNISGGMQVEAQGLSTNYAWEADGISIWGSEVGDPRFESYYNQVWNNTHDIGTAYTNGSSYWKGVDNVGGSKAWAAYIFTAPLEVKTTPTVSTWANRDNIPRSPANIGSEPTSGQQTPDQLPDEYNQANDSNAAPEVIRNDAMVSIGELGHIADPAYANDILTTVAPRADTGGFTNAYSNGGGRSLRIGAPEFTGSTTGYVTAPAVTGWNVDGQRAIDLLDLFTINNANMNASGTNTIAQSMISGGALGRINPNTASANVLAALFFGIKINSDTGMVGGSRTLANPTTMAAQMIANRPYSSLSDLYKFMPQFDNAANYSPALPVTPVYNNFAWESGYPILSDYPSTLNVFNRVHQEAFGKLVQHLTVQSRSYRVYVIGQVLDKSLNPHGSVAMEAGVYLQYNPTEAKYNPTIQYVRILK